MADVTISGLNTVTPQGSNFLPISNGISTGKTQLSAIPVDYSKITNKPNTGIGGMQLFISNDNFTVPEGVVKVEIHAIGGGGGGGTSSSQASNGGSSFISNFDLIAGGGEGGYLQTNSGGQGGICTGVLATVKGVGNSGVKGNYAAGGAGLRLMGSGQYGGGGTAGNALNNNGRSGGSGGYAIGVLPVTPGQTLIVNIGDGGAGVGGYGLPGAVLIKW